MSHRGLPPGSLECTSPIAMTKQILPPEGMRFRSLPSMHF